MQIVTTENAFSNWPAFELELRDVLRVEFEAAAVDRVMDRTREAFDSMQLRKLTGSLREQLAADVLRYETWTQEFRAAKMRMLSHLIENFVALERAG